jgi:hypothetical protein
MRTKQLLPTKKYIIRRDERAECCDEREKWLRNFYLPGNRVLLCLISHHKIAQALLNRKRRTGSTTHSPFFISKSGYVYRTKVTSPEKTL